MHFNDLVELQIENISSELHMLSKCIHRPIYFFGHGVVMHNINESMVGHHTLLTWHPVITICFQI